MEKKESGEKMVKYFSTSALKMRVLALFIILTSFNFAAKADTVDYWHVYYNKVKIREFTRYGHGLITLKLSEIKNTDSISIFYYGDAGCSECKTGLIINDTQDSIVCRSEGKGTGKALTFSLSELVAYQRRTGELLFEVCYIDERSRLRAVQPVIALIRLE